MGIIIRARRRISRYSSSLLALDFAVTTTIFHVGQSIGEMSTIMSSRLSLMLVMLCLLMAMHGTVGRKTAAGRTPLGLSRSNSVKKQLLLAGPTRSVNPREEEMEKARRKAMRKIQYQSKKTAEAIALGNNEIDVDMETTTVNPKASTMKVADKTDTMTNKINAKVQQISAKVDLIPIEEESFEMDTVEQEVERSRAGTAKRKPLLSLLLSKRKLQKK